jgi:transposase
LIDRLKNDIIFRLDCGFLVSDNVPSDVSYSRLITQISQSNVLERGSQYILQSLFTSGSLNDGKAAIRFTLQAIVDRRE